MGRGNSNEEEAFSNPETSVWSFFFADDAPEKREVTHELFREIEEGKYLIFISDVVITEVGRTRTMSRAIAEMEGYKGIQICTPEEVAGYVS